MFILPATLLAALLLNSNEVHAGTLRLNHEAVKVRLAVERQIDAMRTLKETLQLCNVLFPFRVDAVNRNDGTDRTEKIYKEMLSKKSSGDLFLWLLNFLGEDEAIRPLLDKTFARANKDSLDETIALFRLGKNEFYIRWFWLYPTKDGLLLASQDEMTNEIADKIFDTKMLYPVYEVHFPAFYPSKNRNPIWEKGVMKILEAFPSACVTDEEPFELIYSVYPNSSGIPNIIRKSIELAE